MSRMLYPSELISSGGENAVSFGTRAAMVSVARQSGIQRTRSAELGDNSDLGMTELRQKWSPEVGLHHRPPLCESGALLLSYRAIVW